MGIHVTTDRTLLQSLRTARFSTLSGGYPKWTPIYMIGKRYLLSLGLLFPLWQTFFVQAERSFTPLLEKSAFFLEILCAQHLLIVAVTFTPLCLFSLDSTFVLSTVLDRGSIYLAPPILPVDCQQYDQKRIPAEHNFFPAFRSTSCTRSCFRTLQTKDGL